MPIMSSISEYLSVTVCCLTDPNFDQTIRCVECERNFHLKCIYITQSESERFVCNECEETKKGITSWHGKEADNRQKLLKRRKHFEVEKILTPCEAAVECPLCEAFYGSRAKHG